MEDDHNESKCEESVEASKMLALEALGESGYETLRGMLPAVASVLNDVL